jgi:hypothetical protein
VRVDSGTSRTELAFKITLIVPLMMKPVGTFHVRLGTPSDLELSAGDQPTGSMSLTQRRHHMSWRLPIAPRLALAAGLAAFITVGPGWGDPSWASAPTGHKLHHAAPPSKHASLSGKWSGSYSGSFNGTFELTWAQSGKDLSGTIMISGFNNVPTSIHGTVKGVSIQFGTVGSESITYSGSVLGTSMSGTWQIQGGGRTMGSGSWKASKSS